MNINISILIKDIAKVSLGPAERRGILDKEGAEVVGGVVVARYGANPMEVITNVKDQIADISAGLPSKILKILLNSKDASVFVGSNELCQKIKVYKSEHSSLILII